MKIKVVLSLILLLLHLYSCKHDGTTVYNTSNAEEVNRLTMNSYAFLSTHNGNSTRASLNSGTTTILTRLSVNATDPLIKYNSLASHLYRECDDGKCSNDDVLFIFLPGSDGIPSQHKKIAEAIGKTGVRVLVLAYQNNNTLKNICGINDNCYNDARRDRILGAIASPYVDSVADGIANRVLKALQYLKWTQFYSGNTIHWNRIIIGGFSQGAGMAAWIGKKTLVNRVCQFSGTWDNTVGTTPASWLSSTSATPPSQFYGFSHQNDSVPNGIKYLDINWRTLGMGIDDYQLYRTSLTGQKIYADDTDSQCIANPHGCSVVDNATPLNNDGSPRFADAWEYVCGRN